MRNSTVKITTAAMVAGGLVMGWGATPASAHGSREAATVQSVRISSNAAGMHLSATRVHEGRISFGISTANAGGLSAVLFQLHKGVSLSQLGVDLQEEFNPATAAKGTRDLVRDVTFYGLAGAQPGRPVTATVKLDEGTYYLFDTTSPSLPTASSVTRLQVLDGGDEGSEASADRDRLASVSLTSQDRFAVRGQLPARGSVLVNNVSDTIHFMEVLPVKTGTTDAQVQTFLQSGSQNQPPFALNGPSVSTEVLSPGKQEVLSYSLPKGTYLLLCFIADDVTGMPHAVMGMHKVVVLH